MRAGRPAIIYHITYDDGEEVPAGSHTLLTACAQSSHPNSCATAHARTQVAEDLRTLPARRVCEVAPEVQCVQQCGSMLRRVQGVRLCLASEPRHSLMGLVGRCGSELQATFLTVARLTAPHRPRQGCRLQPPRQATPPPMSFSHRPRHLTQTDQRQTLHNAGAISPTSLHTLRSTSAALCLAATRTCRASAL
eukprot:scaffold132851_cov33-Phaeocystis_antarctica.AAC.1